MKNRSGTPFLVKSLCLCFFAALILFGLAPGAFADQYRLIEEIAENYDGDDIIATKTVYQYDRSGRLSGSVKYYHEGSSEKTEYVYGANGALTGKQITSIYQDGTEGGVVCFHYDSNGTQIERENWAWGGDLYWYSNDRIKISNDGSGRVKTIRIDEEDGFEPRTWRYSYDSAGRVKTFEILGYRRDVFYYNGDGGYLRESTYAETGETLTTERYDSSGRLTASVDDITGAVIRWVYDRDGRLTEKYSDGELVCHCKYQFDRYGNIVSVTNIFEDDYSEKIQYQYERVK